MGNWVRDLEERVVAAGGKFVRFTSNAHKMYKLGSRDVILPGVMTGAGAKGYHERKIRKQVDKAIKAHEGDPRFKPLTRIISDNGAANPELLAAPLDTPSPPPANPTSTDAAPTLPEETSGEIKCPECGETGWKGKQGLGKHRRDMHGVLGRAATYAASRGRKPVTKAQTPVPPPSGGSSMNVIAERVQALVAERDQLKAERDDLTKQNAALLKQLKIIQEALPK